LDLIRKSLKKSNSPSTACRQTVSGTISLPSPGFFSPFPHGTGSLSVAGLYLALEGGPPGFPQDSTCPVVLGNLTHQVQLISSTGLSPSVVNLSRLFDYQLNFWLGDKPAVSSSKTPQPRTYNICRLYHTSGLGSSHFARHYFGNHYCFPFLRVLRCFSSPRSPLLPMDSAIDIPTLLGIGFPIQRSPGQYLLSGSPKLIAANHVFPRHPAPRHPPFALSSLAIIMYLFLSQALT
jgi:hypothetical protein